MPVSRAIIAGLLLSVQILLVQCQNNTTTNGSVVNTTTAPASTSQASTSGSTSTSGQASTSSPKSSTSAPVTSGNSASSQSTATQAPSTTQPPASPYAVKFSLELNVTSSGFTSDARLSFRTIIARKVNVTLDRVFLSVTTKQSARRAYEYVAVEVTVNYDSNTDAQKGAAVLTDEVIKASIKEADATLPVPKITSSATAITTPGGGVTTAGNSTGNTTKALSGAPRVGGWTGASGLALSLAVAFAATALQARA